MNEVITGISLAAATGAVDWAAARKQAPFVYLPAGAGAQPEAGLAASLAAAKQAGLLIGLYFAYLPGPDWKAQVALFAELAAKHPAELPPVLAFEQDNGLKKQPLDDLGTKFVTTFEKQTKKPLMIRTSAAFFDFKLPLTNWAKPRPLWVVDTTGAAAPKIPKEWSKLKTPYLLWTMGSGQIGAAAVQLVRFNGDAAAFRKAFKVDAPLVTP